MRPHQAICQHHVDLDASALPRACSIRNFGLGVNNSFSRIGGLLSPFAAVNARAEASWYYTPEAIFAALSLVAGASVLLLPPDKKGKALDDTVEDVTEVPELQRRVSSLVGSRNSSTLTAEQQQQQQQQQQQGLGGVVGAGAAAVDARLQVAEESPQRALLRQEHV
jgi:hypothetical protein